MQRYRYIAIAQILYKKRKFNDIVRVVKRIQNRSLNVFWKKLAIIHGENFFRVYPENMIVVGQHYISKNFNVNLSHLLIKLQNKFI